MKQVKDNMKYWTITETNKKTSEIFKEMESLFSISSYWSNEELDNNFPIPKEITARKFLANVEPDKNTLGKNVREADPLMEGITLRERMLMEINYFKETGEHLDIVGATFCSGSRSVGGGFPFVGLSQGGRVSVGWCSLDVANARFGVRRAVNLETLDFSSSELETAISKVKNRGM